MNIGVYGTPQDNVLTYLPKEDPPPQLVSDLLKPDLQSLPFVERRILGWISAIAGEVERQAIWRNVRGFRFATYGLADPDNDLYTGFAVFAYADPIFFGKDPVSLQLTVANSQFPVFIRRGPLINHAPSIYPQGGRSACWASSKHFQQDAILTAEHVVRNQLGGIPAKTGDAVGFIDASGVGIGNGAVADVAAPGIDAILVDPPQPASGITKVASASAATAINVNPNVAPWSNAAIAFRSGVVQTKVTSVTDPAHWRSRYFPCRLILANWGQHGDSGTMIFDGNNQAIGIYTGAYQDPLARFTEGVAQHLGQVEQTMGLTLHD
jgi:hypothetical protein